MSDLNICPMCNQPIKRRGKVSRAMSAYGGWRQRQHTTFQSVAMQQYEPMPTPESGIAGRYSEAERRRPYRPQNVESDFLVPLVQALATGGVVTIGAGWGAWLYRGFTWEGAVTCGLIATGVYWVGSLIANRKLLWIVESVINSDLDNDGAVGQPEPPAQPVALEIVHKSEANSFQRMFRFDLPAGVSEQDFQDFARGVTQGRGLAESAWIGKGKPFSRPSFSSMMETLRAASIVRWRDESNHALGHELIPSGKLALRMYIQADHSPTEESSKYTFVPDVG